MRTPIVPFVIAILSGSNAFAEEPPVIVRPEAFPTLVNPSCSHCRDEAKRRAAELKPDDRVLAWTRGYSDGGAIPMRFFLNKYRVISDSYGVFVHDADAGFARGFAPSYEFTFHGWRNGVMVMKHKDGTLYSCLTGVAFDGPKKGSRLKPIPTLVSDWGYWLERYPQGVAYHMFDKYQPVELPAAASAESVKSRGPLDTRLSADTAVLGVWAGKSARAYPIDLLEHLGFIREEIKGESVVAFWEPKTRTASAYRPVAAQPRKFKGPVPDGTGVSAADPGVPLPPGTAELPPRKLTLKFDAGKVQDEETHTTWDIAGRGTDGELKGWTLEWVDSVQVKWFAWAAEYPHTTLFTAAATDANKKVKEIAGTAEFLRLLPKPFATITALDEKGRTVSLMLDGEKESKTWPIEPDAEIKVEGWWGRLEQFKPGDRVWAWLKLDRKKKPVSVVMLADELTEYDMHSILKLNKDASTRYTPAQVDVKRAEQQTWLRKRWTEKGLPGTLTFHHVFSGELELTLDHEAMRWGRSLTAGNVVYLQAEPPIKAVVKSVSPWRERTVVRMVVGELESSELKIGQRLNLKMTPLADSVDSGPYPADIDRPRSKAERIEWFLASTYCTCGVSKDTCTGHFYTLASCNPNGCGQPNFRRGELAKMIDRGLTDRQIFDELLKKDGPLLLRPHLKP
ncbi:MAG: DUF3179 domain-containing (seleno)protein [Gemmataceae bacterium]